MEVTQIRKDYSEALNELIYNVIEGKEHIAIEVILKYFKLLKPYNSKKNAHTEPDYIIDVIVGLSGDLEQSLLHSLSVVEEVLIIKDRGHKEVTSFVKAVTHALSNGVYADVLNITKSLKLAYKIKNSVTEDGYIFGVYNDKEPVTSNEEATQALLSILDGDHETYHCRAVSTKNKTLRKV